MTRVKICGITRIEDALLAARLGAAAVGFVCWPGSPRYVSPGRARGIVRALPPLVASVGVFVNQPDDEVEAIAREAALDLVQLHGDEPVESCLRFGRRAIKSVAVTDGFDPSSWPESVTLLADASDPLRRGGTGRTADWEAVARVARRRPVFLAGGLNPGNVARAITSVRPYAIDLSSGVEHAPGIKDPALMGALFDAVRGAEGACR